MDYDPLQAPEPSAWQVLDEQERIERVLNYHRESGDPLPNLRLHAVIHVVVENQLADPGELPVVQTLERLMGQGLDRHQAIHAIGSVVAQHIVNLYHSEGGSKQLLHQYCRGLEQLTAESWLAGLD
jgi:hypothetical protein